MPSCGLTTGDYNALSSLKLAHTPCYCDPSYLSLVPVFVVVGMNQDIKQYIDSFGTPKNLRRPSKSVQQALECLNQGLGTSYKLNRLYEWLNGSRSIPQKVLDFVKSNEVI